MSHSGVDGIEEMTSEKLSSKMTPSESVSNGTQLNMCIDSDT
jgi:hypothetical protein